MAQLLLTITDTTNPYWRRWNWLTDAETTTGLTNANINPSGSSATSFKFALNPQQIPAVEGNRFAKLGVPSTDNPALQIVGGTPLTLNFSGQLRNARSGTTNYDYSADPTACAIADRDCLRWAYKKTVKLTVTLPDGTAISRMRIENFQPTIVGTIPNGYAYDLALVQGLA